MIPARCPIRLVVSDVDGTIVTQDKSVLPATVEAVRRLRDAGIDLALVSSRPPRGMDYVRDAIGVTGPLAAFNGGIVFRDGETIAEHLLPAEDAEAAVKFYTDRKIQIWLFTAGDWVIRDPDGDYVPHERHTVGFDPTVVNDFTPWLDRCGKIVAVSNDTAALTDAEKTVNGLLDGRCMAQRSQEIYLDLNNRDANKGNALKTLAAWYGIDPVEVAAIGDMTNDVPMFKAAGRSIAMGNAPDSVASQAQFRTGPNTGAGWADAMDRYVLGKEGNSS